jgi:AraC family transcriptional regulator
MTNQSSLVLAFPGPNSPTTITPRADYPIAMRAPQWLKRAREIVETRFLEPLSLAEIAAAVGVHLVHLSREFHRYNRCTVGELIRRRRVEHASSLLAYSDMSLAEIALACGFSDQSHFSMMFKRHMGITPSRFRKSAAMQTTVLQPAS